MGNSETRRKAAFARQKLIRAKVAGQAQTVEGCPKFVVDVMLGRLAKWLRIAGFDVLYSNQFSDDELIQISNHEDRVLLSRDTRLLIRKPVKRFLFLESPDIHSQLKQVFASMPILGFTALLTRCLSCNEVLVETAREKVRDAVPAFVYKTQSHFKSCPGCGKIFWAGTHRNSAIQILKRLWMETIENRT